MQLAWVLLTLSLGSAAVSSGLIVVQMKRTCDAWLPLNFGMLSSCYGLTA
jgi:hypothetical protein